MQPCRGGMLLSCMVAFCLLRLAYGHAMCVFGLVDDEDAVKATYALDAAEGVLHELLIVLHVFGVDLDEEVVVAAGVEALRDLVDALHGVHKLLDEFLGVLLKLDVAQDEDAVAHFFGIDNGHVALDVAFALQSLLTLEGGGVR